MLAAGGPSCPRGVSGHRGPPRISSGCLGPPRLVRGWVRVRRREKKKDEKEQGSSKGPPKTNQTEDILWLFLHSSKRPSRRNRKMRRSRAQARGCRKQIKQRISSGCPWPPQPSEDTPELPLATANLRGVPSTGAEHTCRACVLSTGAECWCDWPAVRPAPWGRSRRRKSSCHDMCANGI